MERYFQLGATFLAIAAFVAAFAFFFLAAKHFIQMLSHFQSGRHHMAASIVPFLTAFMPRLFSDRGNFHRLCFIAHMVRFLCCLAFIAVIYGILGIQA